MNGPLAVSGPLLDLDERDRRILRLWDDRLDTYEISVKIGIDEWIVERALHALKEMRSR